jgi:urease accessory protein
MRSTAETATAPFASLPRAAGEGQGGDRGGGRAELVFTCDPAGRTYLRRQYASYPYHVCRPLSFAGDPAGMATIYLQSCAGGIFRDDRLHEHIAADAGASAHVTTQASTIVHSMDYGSARQEVLIEAAADSLVEFLPDPFILFPQSRFASRVRIRADERATVIVADSFICHDPAANGAMFDRFEGDLGVENADGVILARDRFLTGGEAVAAGAPGITGRYGAQGSLFVLDRRRPADDLAAVLCAAVTDVPEAYAGASTLPNGCGAWMRVLAADGVALRAAMLAAWQAARASVTGQIPAPRRK